MSVFVDTSAWYAAADSGDRSNARVKSALSDAADLITSDHILAECWILLRHRLGRTAAERFWEGLRSGAAHVEIIGAPDLEAAWGIGVAYPDQDFSLVDRTSFALMQRLGITEAISLDADFSVYRYGHRRERAFRVRP